MAKECELTSKTYNEIMVVPGGAKVAGEMELNQKTLGFYFTEFTAAMLALGDSATLIVAGESVTVTKKSGEIWVAGDPIFWLEATSNFTNVADGSGKLVGKAKEAAVNLAIIGHVLMKDYYPLTRGYLLGTAGVPYKITAADPLLQIYATTEVIADITRVANFNLVPTVASAGILEALMVNITSGVRTGSWANAIVGRIDYGTTGDAAGGMAAAICGEINLPGKATPGGALYCFDAEMNARENATVVGGHIVAFQKFGLWGNAAAITSFNENGYLFHIEGLGAAGAGKIFDTIGSATPTHELRIKIDAVDYFIMLQATQ